VVVNVCAAANVDSGVAAISVEVTPPQTPVAGVQVVEQDLTAMVSALLVIPLVPLVISVAVPVAPTFRVRPCDARVPPFVILT
jgi:hypothetical protein